MNGIQGHCGPRPGCLPPDSTAPGGCTHTINGTKGDDVVHISKADGLAGCLGLYEVCINGKSQLMTREQLQNTQFNLGKGNDTLLVDGDVDVGIHADGGKGNDVMIGGSGNDHFNGGKGNDILLGRGGHDQLSGGKGHDIVLGGRGNDHVSGGKGNDWLFGGRGHDDLSGGRGHDHLRGGRGNDHLDGGRGCDDVRGGPGHDQCKPDLRDWLPPPHRLLAALLG